MKQVAHKQSGEVVEVKKELPKRKKLRVIHKDGTTSLWDQSDTVPVKKIKKSKAIGHRGEKKRQREEEASLSFNIPKSYDRTDKTQKGTISAIQIKIYGGKSIKQVRFRQFGKFEEALEYIKEYLKNEKIIDRTKSGRNIKLSNGDIMWSNYNISYIINNKKPEQLLIDISDPGETVGGNKETKPVTTTKTKQRVNGELIPLKLICRDHIPNLEPRKARAILRRLAKTDKIPHDWRGRWEFPRADIDQVVDLLKEEMK